VYSRSAVARGSRSGGWPGWGPAAIPPATAFPRLRAEGGERAPHRLAEGAAAARLWFGRGGDLGAAARFVTFAVLGARRWPTGSTVLAPSRPGPGAPRRRCHPSPRMRPTPESTLRRPCPGRAPRRAGSVGPGGAHRPASPTCVRTCGHRWVEGRLARGRRGSTTGRLRPDPPESRPMTGPPALSDPSSPSAGCGMAVDGEGSAAGDGRAPGEAPTGLRRSGRRTAPGGRSLTIEDVRHWGLGPDGGSLEVSRVPRWSW